MATDCSEKAKQRDSGSVQKTMASITAATSSAPIRQQHLDHHPPESRTIKSSARTLPPVGLNILGRIL